MESIAIDRFAGSELDITGIRLLTPQEIEAVAGGEYDVYEMLTVTATGVVAGAAGGAAYTWWTGTGVLAGATAGGISVGVSAFVTYNMGYFWGWFS